MQTNDIEQLKLKVLSQIKRDTNGAVQGAMLEHSGSEPYFSYGVSIPKIKLVAKEYFGNHDLALSLFSSSIRELKLAALYIESPDNITSEQLQLWSSSFNSVEIADNSSLLLSQSAIGTREALKWVSSIESEPIYAQRAGYLTLSRRVKFHYDDSELPIYLEAYQQALSNFKNTQSSTRKSMEVFLVAIAHRVEKIRLELLDMRLSEDIDWQIEQPN